MAHVTITYIKIHWAAFVSEVYLCKSFISQYCGQIEIIGGAGGRGEGGEGANSERGEREGRTGGEKTKRSFTSNFWPLFPPSLISGGLK